MSRSIELDLRERAQRYQEQLKRLKVLAFDIDGILTNSQIFWSGEECGFNRSFNVHDGYGLKLMQRLGYKVGVITGGNSLGVLKRFKVSLKLDFVYMGNEDKREAYQELLAMGYNDEEILYMGDELFDIPLLKRCGFSATVKDSSQEVREAVDYICERAGGEGAAREVIDMIRYANNLEIPVPDFD